jgi:hypothetical protein
MNIYPDYVALLRERFVLSEAGSVRSSADESGPGPPFSSAFAGEVSSIDSRSRRIWKDPSSVWVVMVLAALGDCLGLVAFRNECLVLEFRGFRTFTADIETPCCGDEGAQLRCQFVPGICGSIDP